MQPEQRLLAAVVETAINDWNRYKARPSGDRHKAELVSFFHGKWFAAICDMLNVNPDVALEKLHKAHGVPLPNREGNP